MKKSYTTRVEKRHGRLWIMLPDSIDMDNYQKIEENIMGEIEHEPQDVVLDFSRTKTLFSSGIGLIVRLKKRVNEKGLNLSLVSIGNKIKEGLENVGLHNVFEIFPSEEAFIKAKGT